MDTVFHPIVLASIDDDLIPIIVMSISGFIAVIAIVFGTVKSMVQTATREKTRREIAAYVAEGSISPQDGERLMRAGRMDGDDKRC